MYLTHKNASIISKLFLISHWYARIKMISLSDHILKKYFIVFVISLLSTIPTVSATITSKSPRNSLAVAASSLNKQDFDEITVRTRAVITSIQKNKPDFYEQFISKTPLTGPKLPTSNIEYISEKTVLEEAVHAFEPKLKNLAEKYRQSLKSTDFSKIVYHPESIEPKPNVHQVPEQSLPVHNELFLDKGKEKVAEDEMVIENENDGFVDIPKSFDMPLWSKEKLEELQTAPFGKFLSSHIHHEELQSILAGVSVGATLPHYFSDLQREVMRHTQSIDLSDIDDNWIIMDDKLAPKFQEYAWKSKVINAEKKENGVIVFFLFHGTFVDYTEFGKNNDTQLTKDLINDAKILAHENNCAVKVISFNWSGELNAPSRKEAASILKHYFVTDDDCMNAKQITAFSHSFGGDVLLQFAELLRPHNKTLDWAVMAGTPLGEATNFDAVDKKARVLEPTPDEECFNSKLIIQCFSRGDVTQAAGSMQMTSWLLNPWALMTRWIFNPIGIAERRLPLRINNNKRVVNCHFEHEGNLCTHVDIKWHAARALPHLIPMVSSLYPHAHDLSVATGDHDLIITMRNPIFSPGYEKTADRSDQATILGKEMFKKLYDKPIGEFNTWAVFKAYQEFIHARYSQIDQGRKELIKKFEKKSKE